MGEAVVTNLLETEGLVYATREDVAEYNKKRNLTIESAAWRILGSFKDNSFQQATFLDQAAGQYQTIALVYRVGLEVYRKQAGTLQKGDWELAMRDSNGTIGKDGVIESRHQSLNSSLDLANSLVVIDQTEREWMEGDDKCSSNKQVVIEGSRDGAEVRLVSVIQTTQKGSKPQEEERLLLEFSRGALTKIKYSSTSKEGSVQQVGEMKVEVKF